jgi:hypothetical protein
MRVLCCRVLRLIRRCRPQGERKAAFTFDKVFPLDTEQQYVYDYAAKPIVEGKHRHYTRSFGAMAGCGVLC